MSAPRTVGAAVQAAELATAAQADAQAATVNAAAIAALSAGVGRPVPIPAVTGPPGATDGPGVR